MCCIAAVNEDRRKEPPNPREPVELIAGDSREKQQVAAVRAADNQSQLQAAAPSASHPITVQVHCSLCLSLSVCNVI